MAKKSNKTEHVLKLITKNDDTMQEDDFFSLDHEISENGTSAIRNAILVNTDENPESESAAVSSRAKDEAAAEIPETREESPAEIPVTREEPPAEIPMVKEDPPQEQQQEPPTIRAFREQEKISSVILEQNDNLVNIAEILAREKIGLVMERMKVCTCKTCVNDVLALALNSLPTKYVTTDSGKQYFQLDIYKKQYETDILAALTKACVRVKASPRH